MSKISIRDLEVFYHIGVTDEERAKPQRLLVTLDLIFDFTTASVSDRVEKTIDYHAIVKDLLSYGEGRSWKLLEKLVANIADRIMTSFRPQALAVEVKKFPFPQVQYVSVSLTRTRK